MSLRLKLRALVVADVPPQAGAILTMDKDIFNNFPPFSAHLCRQQYPTPFPIHQQPGLPFMASNVTCVGDNTFTGITKALQNISSPMIRGSGLTKPLAIRLSASRSTSAQGVVSLLPAYPAIPAPCVATCPIDARNVLSDTLFPIITKLQPDTWEAALDFAGILPAFLDVPEGLWSGFFVGLEPYNLSCTFIPKNHYTSLDDEELIVNKYNKEIALGRVSHGYDPDILFSLIGHFHTAPLAVIDQNSGKHRIIVNHSYPKNKQSITLDLFMDFLATDISTTPHIIDPTITSINTVINLKKIQCAWGSFSECYLLVADAVEGSQAAVFDVDSAFRNIPVHPSARRFLAVMIKGKIHIDHVLNLGASPSPGIFSRVADAAVKIYLSHGTDAIIKWVDNFVFFRYPTGPKRGSDYDCFSNIFMYIGFQWDLSWKEVMLPAQKKIKYLAKLSTWILGSHHTSKEAEQLISTLNHVCLIVPEGRSYLVSLYKFHGGFKLDSHAETKHKLSATFMEDVNWWRTRLLNDFVGLQIIRPPEASTTKLFVNASTSWGIGLVLNGKWLAWEFHEGWKTDGCDIGWGEMVTVKLVIHTLLTSNIPGCYIVINSDNQGMVGALNAGRSRGTHQNAILQEIVKLIQGHNVWILTTWIPTLENIVDAPSQCIFPGRDTFHPYKPKLPFHLRSFYMVP